MRTRGWSLTAQLRSKGSSGGFAQVTSCAQAAVLALHGSQQFSVEAVRDVWTGGDQVGDLVLGSACRPLGDEVTGGVLDGVDGRGG
jgi:hypothetical protein